jgi:hypothetical protein
MTQNTKLHHSVHKMMLVYCILNERSHIRTFMASLCTTSFNAGCFALIVLAECVRILFVRLLFFCNVGTVMQCRIFIYLWYLSTCVSLRICTTFPLWKSMYWLIWFALGSSPYGPNASRPYRRALWSHCINLQCVQSISSGSPAKMLFTYLIPHARYVFSTSKPPVYNHPHNNKP